LGPLHPQAQWAPRKRIDRRSRYSWIIRAKSMDLRVHYPRSVREKLAGYVHLARMIDKCRAVLAGTQGEYIYPCPMDRRLLEFAGLETDRLPQTVHARSSAQAVSDWFAE